MGLLQMPPRKRLAVLSSTWASGTVVLVVMMGHRALRADEICRGLHRGFTDYRLHFLASLVFHFSIYKSREFFSLGSQEL